MVEPSRLHNALAAMNAVLVAARTMAYERRPHEELAEVLDVAEYLPALLVEARDRSAEFREQLVCLASKYPSFTFAIHEFDKPIAADDDAPPSP